jgi:hypothetical protein
VNKHQHNLQDRDQTSVSEQRHHLNLLVRFMKITLLAVCYLLFSYVNAEWTLTYGFGSHVITGNGNTKCTAITNFLADEDFTWSVSGLSSTFCCLSLYVDSGCMDQILQACSSETETVSENVGSYKVTGCVALTSTVASTLSATSTHSTVP